MRVSVDETDPGFTDDILFKVFLDGAEASYVITADEEQGYALKYVDPLIHDGDEWETEEFHGHVRLERYDGKLSDGSADISDESWAIT